MLELKRSGTDKKRRLVRVNIITHWQSSFERIRCQIVCTSTTCLFNIVAATAAA
jgi:hypothetical protein